MLEASNALSQLHGMVHEVLRFYSQWARRNNDAERYRKVDNFLRQYA